LNRNQGLSTKQIRYVLYSITNTFIAQPLHNLKSTTQYNEYDNVHVITTQQHKHRFAELYASFISRDNCFKSMFIWNFLETGYRFDTPIITILTIYRRLIFHFNPLYVYHPPFVIDRLIQLIYVYNTLKTLVTILQTDHKINKIRNLIRYKLWTRGFLCGSLVRSTDFLTYYISHQKQRDYPFFYNIYFLFLFFLFYIPFFFSFYFLFSSFHNLFTQNYKKNARLKKF
jgi:hypothetical protein